MVKWQKGNVIQFMNELISVIVPIYNVESYLVKCVDSILNQTYSNIEIILVDDGSTDNSSNICDDYKKKDNRIKVIHQKNSGLTITRRAGANLACGKYIGFVDGDDWIEPNMYQVLYNYIRTENVDIVTSRGYREYLWGTGVSTLGDTILAGKYEISENNDYILTHFFPGIHGKTEYINGAVWNKLFRSDIIRDILNEIDGHIHGQMDDTICVLGSIIRSKSILITQDILYHHREREGSFTYSKNPKGLLQLNYAYLALKQLLDQSTYKEKILSDLLEYVSCAVIAAYNNLFDIDEYIFPQYFFKSNKIPRSSKILIYGSGSVGKSFWNQLKADGNYELMGIVDKNPSKIPIHFKPSYNIESINKIDFDYVIIAIKDIDLAREIHNNLVSEGIAPEKIIWEQPLSIYAYYHIDKNFYFSL